MSPNEKPRPLATDEASQSVSGGDHKLESTVAVPPVHGGDIGAEAANVFELNELVDLIEQRASGGRVVCACGNYVLDHLGELSSHNTIGAAFRIAALHGTIRPIGFHRATRRARQSGVHALWIGADA